MFVIVNIELLRKGQRDIRFDILMPFYILEDGNYWVKLPDALWQMKLYFQSLLPCF